MIERSVIFPINIYTTNIEVDRQSIITQAKSLIKSDTGLERSNIGGWQSSLITSPDNVTKDLFIEIQNVMNEIAVDYGLIQDGLVPELGNYWYNINSGSDFNLLHNHPGSTFSCVYYLQVPPNSGSLTFRRMDQLEWTMPLSSNYIPRNGSHSVNVQEGMLVVFPSYMYHYVQPSEIQGERITMAFNYTLGGLSCGL